MRRKYRKNITVEKNKDINDSKENTEEELPSGKIIIPVNDDMPQDSSIVS